MEGGGKRVTELMHSACNREPTSARQLLRQQRELEEKRKFGLAPLEVDSVTGQEISTNVPHTMTEAPWYYGSAGPTLEHHRHRGGTADDVLQDSTARVVVTGKATRFVAGACKNCGSRTHKTQECTQSKKKVGAHYSGRITGLDVQVQHAKQSYSMKRDRFVGDVGVDLLRSSAEGSEGDVSAAAAAPLQRHKPEMVFDARTAQHGGTEIKELPKYLQNLEAPDGVFFDPKTGSMRANPNAADPTRAFHGDLTRYHSGDFYHYVETQYRFLAGQSKSFVDFEYDEAMRRSKEGSSPVAADAGPRAVGEDALVRSLYGTEQSGMPGAIMADDSDTADTKRTLPQASPLTTNMEETKKFSVHEKVKLCLGLRPVNEGHGMIFGSFFDTDTLTWGYKCCGGVGPDAASCKTETV